MSQLQKMCCARVLHLPDIFIINNGKYNPFFFSVCYSPSNEHSLETKKANTILYITKWCQSLQEWLSACFVLCFTHQIGNCGNKSFKQRNKKRRISELLFTYNETKRPAIKHCKVVHVIYFKSSVKSFDCFVWGKEKKHIFKVPLYTILKSLCSQ